MQRNKVNPAPEPEPTPPCPFCGHDSVPNGGTCPECGTSIPRQVRRCHRSDSLPDESPVTWATIEAEYDGRAVDPDDPDDLDYLDDEEEDELDALRKARRRQ